MKLRQNILPIIAAFIWGTAFVAQRNGSEYVEAFTFLAFRSAVGAITLGILIFIIFLLKSKKIIIIDKPKGTKKDLIYGGIFCGIALFTASYFQQLGISLTSAGKAGFITALYIILVPIFGIFINKKAPFNVWISVLLSCIGLYLLCIKENFVITYGDILVIVCAFIFAIHILIIDYYTQKTDGVKLSCIQFIVVGILSFISMFLFENPDINELKKCVLPILYTGVFSSGVAYTLQIISQKNSNPTVVCILLSLESVFAALAGTVILGEKMLLKEYFGCVLMFIAVIIAQIDFKYIYKRNIKKGQI